MQSPKIIYQDDFILVVDKPSGLVVNRSATVKQKSLQDILIERGWISLKGITDGVFIDRTGLAHRLDKETSGVLVVARSPEALSFLLAEFKHRQVRKMYKALVHGSLPPEGEIKAPIKRHPVNKRKFSVFIGGRSALTTYQLVKSYRYQNKFLSLVNVFPFTGRTHQIRVHFRYLNHPVVGDKIYAGRRLSQWDKQLTERIFLHAQRIEFRHPSSRRYVKFESPLPDDLEQVLAKLNT